jgi:hypothetical protein
MRVDAAGKSEKILCVENLLGELSFDFRRKPYNLAVGNRDVQAINGRLVGTHNASIFYEEINRIGHC